MPSPCRQLCSLFFRCCIPVLLCCISAASLHAEINIEQFHGTFSVNEPVRDVSHKPGPISPSMVFTKNSDKTNYYFFALNLYFSFKPQEEYIVNAIAVQNHLPEKPNSNDYKRLALAAWPDLDPEGLEFAANTIKAWIKKNPNNPLLLLIDLTKPQNAGLHTEEINGDIQYSKLIRVVDPVYPQEARMKRIMGAVRLKVHINEQGIIEIIKPLDGHPLLVPAALAAVQQWQYSPTFLDGEPVSVIATVTVKFKLNWKNPL